LKTVHFDSVCPFLVCHASGPHDHPVCALCEAVNWGNMRCVECQRNRPQYNAQIEAKIASEKGGGT